MQISRVATRYAKSLLQLAVERGELDQVLKDIQLLHSTFEESRELVAVMQSPVINSDRKLNIIEELFGSSMGEMTLKFVRIMIRKNRAGLLHHTSISFTDQYKDHKGIHTVFLETAVPVKAEIRDQVMKIVTENLDGEIELVEQVRPDLLGGLVLRFKDRQLDASVRANIMRLKRQFSKDLYTVKY